MMFKSALLLLCVFTIPSAYSQPLQARRDEPNGSVDMVHTAHDDKQKRREELRAALKAQGGEPATAPVKPISAHERAALREQLRVQGATPSVSQP